MSDSGLLYLHGFASSPASIKAKRFRAFVEADGLAFRAPDLNLPDFSALTLTRSIEAARAELWPKTLLVGSSFGGYTAALLAETDPRVVGMVLLAPAFDFAPRLLARHGAEGMRHWQTVGQVETEHYAYGEPRPIRYELYADACRYSGRPAIQVPTVIIHGKQDITVPPAGSIAVAQASAPATLRLVEDDHGLLQHFDLIQAETRRLARELGFLKA